MAPSRTLDKSLASIWIVAALGIALSLMTYTAVRTISREKLNRQFSVEANDLAVRIKNRFDRVLLAMGSVTAFYNASNQVNGHEFRIFSDEILKNQPSLQTLFWIPLLRNSDAPAFIQGLHREGYRDFRLTELDSGGTPSWLKDRPFYYPITYIEPVNGNARALGIDLGTSPEMKKLLNAARDSQTAHISQPRGFLSNLFGEQTFFAVTAIYEKGKPLFTVDLRRRYLKGFIGGTYHVESLITPLIGGIHNQFLNALIVDSALPPGEQILYHNAGSLLEARNILNHTNRRTLSLPGREKSHTFHIHQTFSVGDRTWEILIAARPGFIAGAVDLMALGVLVLGAFGTWIIVTYMRSERRKRMQMKQLADEQRRSAEQVRDVNRKLERLTITDPLTDCLNRRGFQQAFTREIAFMERGKRSTIMLLDLDNFKMVNDELGYAAGDAVLKETVSKVQQAVRPTDYVARVGGDEFLILFPDTRKAEAEVVADRLRNWIATTPVVVQEKRIKLTASFGICDLMPGLTTIDEVIQSLQLYLRRGKKAGKNQVWAHDTGTVRSRGREAMGEIRNILRNDEFFRIVKQPIIDCQANQVAGHEYLCRFQRTLHVKSPDDYFRFCRENNILAIADIHCFKSAAHVIQSQRTAGHHFINLFPSTLLEVEARTLIKIIESTRISPENFCLELSEQQIIGDARNLMDPVTELRSLGIRIAMDDIGFGHSCLESLIILEPDVAKIDRYLITGAAAEKGRRKILKKLVGILDNLGATIVAEGIETKEDIDLATEYGIRLCQGFFLGVPK